MAVSWPVVALADSAVWAGWSALVSWQGSRWAASRLSRDSWLTRPRAWERNGRIYQRVGIRRWRRFVPDAGQLLGGRTRQLAKRRDPAEWEALAAETRRSEEVHWRIVAVLPVMLVWNRGILVPAMIVYAAVANLPCVAIQRYNRSRLGALLARSRAAR